MSALFGVSASDGVDPDPYLTLLKPHGCDIHGHTDRWGVAAFDGSAARLFKETRPFTQTSFLCPFRGSAFRSRIIVAHINKAEAAVASATFANAQPFEREVGGRSWVFAHDGALPERDDLDLGGFRPIGQTSSERAFCSLLETVRELLPTGNTSIDVNLIAERLARKASALNALGLFNFLLSDGEHLFAHTHPVLHTADRPARAGEGPFATIVICSHPMTGGQRWRRLPPNSLTVFRDGRQIAQMPTDGEAPSAAWEHQRADAEAIQRRRGEAEASWRQHHAQFGDAMNYDSS